MTRRTLLAMIPAPLLGLLPMGRAIRRPPGQPRALECLALRRDDGGFGLTVIYRRWRPEDVPRCTLCPKGTCCAVGQSCMISVEALVPKGEAAYFKRHGFMIRSPEGKVLYLPPTPATA